jgi:hypothetical protein
MATKVHGTKTFTRRRGGGGGRRRRRTNCYARTREEEEEEDILLLTLQKCFVDINRPPEDADKVVEILRENWFDDIDLNSRTMPMMNITTKMKKMKKDTRNCNWQNKRKRRR